MENGTYGKKASALYVSHGGGPLPLLGESSHQEMVNGLRSIAKELEKPRAVVVISAHWERDSVTISSAEQPSLIYDYSGFPQEAYEIRYPAQGSPVLAEEVYTLMQEAKIDSLLDNERGFDHGLFVPLKIMFPEADIPCIQVSLLNSLNPSAHIEIGRALERLQGENILLLGSGFSFHNMKTFFQPSTQEIEKKNESFEEWLMDTCSNRGIDEKEREHRLIHWEEAPAARFCHPREEHLLPLHVCYGLAGSPANRVFSWKIMGKQVSAYLW